jgi:hypothetical protein
MGKPIARPCHIALKASYVPHAIVRVLAFASIGEPTKAQGRLIALDQLSPIRAVLACAHVKMIRILQTPKIRRLLQFGIGMMLIIVTVIALWLSWELKFVRERQFVIQEYKAQIDLPSGPTVVGHIPWWRSLMGDEGVSTILLLPEDPSSSRFSALFPEATTWWFKPPSNWSYTSIGKAPAKPRHNWTIVNPPRNID